MSQVSKSNLEEENIERRAVNPSNQNSCERSSDRPPVHPKRESGRHPTLEEEVRKYLSKRRRRVESNELSERTYETDQRSLKLLVDWANGMCETMALANIDKNYLRQFKHHRLSSVGRSTVAKNLRHIQSFFSDLTRRRILPRNPMQEVTVPDTRRRTELPNKEEFAELKRWLDEQIASREDPEWIHFLMKIACHTGMRLGELTQIKWEQGPQDHDTDRARNYVYLSASERTLTIKFKRNVRRIPIGHLWEVFQQLHQRRRNGGTYVFASPEGGHYDNSYVCRQWKKEVQKIDELKRAYTCHCIRHAVVTSLMRKGYSDRKIGKLVGHSSAQITDRYGHLVASDLNEMMSDLSES